MNPDNLLANAWKAVGDYYFALGEGHLEAAKAAVKAAVESDNDKFYSLAEFQRELARVSEMSAEKAFASAGEFYVLATELLETERHG